MELEKTFASNPSNKGLMSRICKTLENLNTKKSSQPMNETRNELTFLKSKNGM